MKKKSKQYPMDGPPRLAQTLMLDGPRKNREQLKEILKNSKVTRPETLEVMNLK